MSATSETLAIFLGVSNLAWPALIAADRIRTRNQRRPATRPPRAEVAADPTPATPAPVHAVTTIHPQNAAGAAGAPPAAPAARPAVARSIRNPGLAAYAASRPREQGRFVRVNGQAS